MRIGLVSTAATTIRPGGGGSVETINWLLARELVRRGHDVTVFGVAGSESAGRLVAALPGPYSESGSPGDYHLCEFINLARAVELSGELDVIHTHAYLWGMSLDALSRAPMIHTMHIMPDSEYASVWRLFPHSRVTAISAYQWSEFPDLRPSAVVHHGVDESQYIFQATPSVYASYLGRFTGGKGILTAIAAARQAGIPLHVAGPRNRYYEDCVEPLLDGDIVRYAGYLGGCDKAAFLGNSRVLVYPVSAPEPFGMVMIEAMMCGTPVAALRVGAVAEIVDDGVTGALADTTSDLPAAILRAASLDRSAVRARALEQFSSARMAGQYLDVYRQVVGHA